MAASETQDFCSYCNRLTLHRKQLVVVSHAVHALLALLCCFLWLPVWLCFVLFADFRNQRSPYRCSVCGGTREVAYKPELSEEIHPETAQEMLEVLKPGDNICSRCGEDVMLQQEMGQTTFVCPSCRHSGLVRD